MLTGSSGDPCMLTLEKLYLKPKVWGGGAQLPCCTSVCSFVAHRPEPPVVVICCRVSDVASMTGRQGKPPQAFFCRSGPQSLVGLYSAGRWGLGPARVQNGPGFAVL